MIIPYDSSIDIYESELNLDNFEAILVLDDDRSVFERWSQKLQSFSGKIDYINTPDQIESHIDKIKSKRCLALVDQEIRGSSDSGHSTIVKKNIFKEAVLVTNNYANDEVYQKVKNGGPGHSSADGIESC